MTLGWIIAVGRKKFDRGETNPLVRRVLETFSQDQRDSAQLLFDRFVDPQTLFLHARKTIGRDDVDLDLQMLVLQLLEARVLLGQCLLDWGAYTVTEEAFRRCSRPESTSRHGGRIIYPIDSAIGFWSFRRRTLVSEHSTRVGFSKLDFILLFGKSLYL